jgi:hypothetical protein
VTYRLAGSNNAHPFIPLGFFSEAHRQDIEIIVWFAHGCAPPLRFFSSLALLAKGVFSPAFCVSLRDKVSCGGLRGSRCPLSGEPVEFRNCAPQKIEFPA